MYSCFAIIILSLLDSPISPKQVNFRFLEFFSQILVISSLSPHPSPPCRLPRLDNHTTHSNTFHLRGRPRLPIRYPSLFFMHKASPGLPQSLPTNQEYRLLMYKRLPPPPHFTWATSLSRSLPPTPINEPVFSPQRPFPRYPPFHPPSDIRPRWPSLTPTLLLYPFSGDLTPSANIQLHHIRVPPKIFPSTPKYLAPPFSPTLRNCCSLPPLGFYLLFLYLDFSLSPLSFFLYFLVFFVFFFLQPPQQRFSPLTDWFSCSLSNFSWCLPARTCSFRQGRGCVVSARGQIPLVLSILFPPILRPNFWAMAREPVRHASANPVRLQLNKSQNLGAIFFSARGWRGKGSPQF